MKVKVRIYAIFQFLSMLSLILVVLAFTIFMYNASVTSIINVDEAFWLQQFSLVFTFRYSESISIFASTLIYLSILLWIFTVGIGWWSSRIQSTNFYDMLFLMFLFLPIISNIFCLMAQLALKSNIIESANITKKDLIKIASDLREDIKES